MNFPPPIVLCSLIIPLILGSPARATQQETGFLDRKVSVQASDYRYQIFVPDNWSRKKKWPVVLFLHGSGERGSDGLLQTDVGLPAAIRRDRTRFPVLVVMPQCSGNRWWTDPLMEEMALAALTAATQEFHGDSKRIYVTGLSMGGYGTLDLAAKYPARFAAIAPVCGGLFLPAQLRKDHPELSGEFPEEPANPAKAYADFAAKIGKQPVWIFHGADDDTVPVEGSRKIYSALKAAGGNVRFTEYPGVGHNSWDKAYLEPELMNWLLSKTL